MLARAGIKSEDNVGDEVDNFEVDGNADTGVGDTVDSEDEYFKPFEQWWYEYYKPVEQWRAAKLAAKAEDVFKVCLLCTMLFATS